MNLTFLLITSCSQKSATSNNYADDFRTEEENNYVPDGYSLVWSDEFDDTSNNLPGDNWWFETGNHGWGNNELQNYVDRTVGNDTVAKIKDGILTITALKTDIPYQGSDYISARMNTSQSWKYGYFEMKAKMPTGRGTWAAFWMLPKDFTEWPLDGEIDIMEYVGYKPNITHSTIHTSTYNHKEHTEKSGEKSIQNAQTDFHIYALEWTEDEITGYVDGKSYFSFKNDKKSNKKTWPFAVPFYVKLNLAVGGNWGGVEGIDTNIFPAHYEIDYVRVYQKR
ncbi:glycoside hydrolase family 16 protein [Dysgonomonas sp. OttesenSCG-928-M03]|nr:glycoside hydrolase family 16 protein [Dysgonomonas sp. OttesenSCG-928-M03]